MLPPGLSAPYDELVQASDWVRYVKRLRRDGLEWCLNLDFAPLAAHLVPLQKLPNDIILQDRIGFLFAACHPNASIETLKGFYQAFLERQDYDAAVACASLAVFLILDRGRRFSRFRPWDDGITEILASGAELSPSARAAAVGTQGIVLAMHHGDYILATRKLREAIFLADAAGCIGLRLWYSVHICYGYACAGNLDMMDVILFDMAPLCRGEGAPYFFSAHYQSLKGILRSCRGDISDAKRIHLEIVSHPLFKKLSLGGFLFIYGNLLSCAILDNDVPLIRECFRNIRSVAIPERNHYNHAYLHLNLGLSHFALGNPRKALIHLEEAAEREKLVETGGGRCYLFVLIGQVMSELDRDEEAILFFKDNIEIWDQFGLFLFSSTGHFELARMFLRQGSIEKAREHYEKAFKIFPVPSPPVPMHRPREFLDDLKQVLFRDTEQPVENCAYSQRQVFIETFGELCLHLGDRTIYDRQWKGGRTRLLLKAILVFGPAKVPLELLTDLLWPDAEGDTAINNLRVSLCRLRKVGQNKDRDLIQWIKVKNRRVSLVSPLCEVDSVRFRFCLNRSMEDGDIRVTIQTLDLYKDDFLKNDVNESWIIRHRELLRKEYVKGVLFLAARASRKDHFERITGYLSKAIERDACNEELHLALMNAYLKLGFRTKAAEAYRSAETMLKDILNMTPGAELTALYHDAVKNR